MPEAMRTSGDSVTHQLLACRSPADIGTRMLGLMTDTIEAESGTVLDFCLNRNGEVDLRRSWSYNLPADCHRQYSTHYFRSDPMVASHLNSALRASHHRAATETFTVNNVAELCGLTSKSQAYYQQFWSANGLGQMLVITLWLPALRDHGVVLALHRHRGSRPFSDDTLHHAEQVAPAVCAALGNVLLAEELTRERALGHMLASCLDPLGVALLDDDRRILLANEAADRHWAGLSGDRALKRYISEVAEDNSGPRRIGDIEVIHRRSKDGTGGVVLTSPILSSAEVTLRCRGYGMSLRESEVVGLVCDGLSNPEISDVLGISVRTVENHLRAIFEKAAVENRMRLMRVMLGH